MEPATNWFDESFATILKSHERFARQQRSRSSITYHVTSTNSRIDHQLSGIKNIVLLHEQSAREKTYNSVLFTFIARLGSIPRHLTIFLNSLIRVTRRDEKLNLLSNLKEKNGSRFLHQSKILKVHKINTLIQSRSKEGYRSQRQFI